MPQSFVAAYYHIIFSTKHRQPFIKDELSQRLYEYIGGTIRNRKGILLSIGGIEDHVHLLTSIHKEECISTFLREIKSSSSRWVHEEFGNKEFGWQNGYAAFSVSYSGLAQVTKYIENQREHHKHQDFKAEYIQYLDLHHIPYDPRYVFE